MTILEKEVSNNKKLLSLWEQHTLQPANIEVDFFESGGDSLSAIKMIVEIQKLYNVDISLESFMRNPTVLFLFENIQNFRAPRIEVN